MTVWIGLTGGIGSGKSSVAAHLAKLGVPCIDADAVNRRLISTPDSIALQQLAQVFGTHVLQADGTLNRDAVRQLVFADSHAKQQLEAVLHPLIIAEIRALQAAETRAPYGIVEIPTLAEHPHFQQLVQYTVAVCADESTRIKRVQQRSGLNAAQIRAIIAAQATDEARLTIADCIIHNTGSVAELAERVRTLHQQWQQQFTAAQR